MDAQKVEFFLSSHKEDFPFEQMDFIHSELMKVPESRWWKISATPFKNSIIALVLSIVVGGAGVDRFYIGDIGLGVCKLLTLGGLGIWTVVDWFLIMPAARRKNMELLMAAL